MTRSRTVLLAGFVLGLAVRLALLTSKGTLDMDTYLDWGHRTLDLGLPNAYSGIYFPAAFQLFGAIVRLSEVTGLSEIAAIKGVNLVCDAGTFGLMLILLHRWRAPLWYALLYWISPFFLAIHWLGYVDAQMALCVMAFLVILDLGHSRLTDLAAGVPLAPLAVLKPQGVLIIGSIVLFAAVAGTRARPRLLPARRVALMLIMPAALFVAYSLWVATGLGHSVWFVTETVLETRSHMPALSANMLNPWAIVAEVYRPPGEPIYVVEEPAVFHQVALVVTIGLIVAALAWLVPCVADRSFSQQVLIAMAAAMAIYPMTATAAHENHLFIGLMCLVLVAALLRSAAGTWLLCALLLVMFVNLFGIYRFGVNQFTGDYFQWVTSLYPPGVRVVLAGVSTGVWVAVMLVLARALGARSARARPERDVEVSLA